MKRIKALLRSRGWTFAPSLGCWQKTRRFGAGEQIYYWRCCSDGYALYGIDPLALPLRRWKKHAALVISRDGAEVLERRVCADVRGDAIAFLTLF